jgi:hypothetical protein
MFVLAVCPTGTDPKAIVCVDTLSVPVAGSLPVVAELFVVVMGAVQPASRKPNINVASSSILACLIFAREVGQNRVLNRTKVTICDYLCSKIIPRQEVTLNVCCSYLSGDLVPGGNTTFVVVISDL